MYSDLILARTFFRQSRYFFFALTSKLLSMMLIFGMRRSSSIEVSSSNWELVVLHQCVRFAMKSESPSIWWTKNTYKEMICPIDIRTLLIEEQCCLYFPSVPIKGLKKVDYEHTCGKIIVLYWALLSSSLINVSKGDLRIFLLIVPTKIWSLNIRRYLRQNYDTGKTSSL